MRLLIIPAMMLTAPAAAQWGPPGGAHSTPDGSALIARSRAEDAAYVLGQLRATCASRSPGARSRCREGLRLLAEARDEMVARRAAAATDGN
jgi:hypothetical protein